MVVAVQAGMRHPARTALSLVLLGTLVGLGAGCVADADTSEPGAVSSGGKSDNGTDSTNDAEIDTSCGAVASLPHAQAFGDDCASRLGGVFAIGTIDSITKITVSMSHRCEVADIERQALDFYADFTGNLAPDAPVTIEITTLDGDYGAGGMIVRVSDGSSVPVSLVFNSYGVIGLYRRGEMVDDVQMFCGGPRHEVADLPTCVRQLIDDVPHTRGTGTGVSGSFDVYDLATSDEVTRPISRYMSTHSTSTATAAGTRWDTSSSGGASLLYVSAPSKIPATIVSSRDMVLLETATYGGSRLVCE